MQTPVLYCALLSLLVFCEMLSWKNRYCAAGIYDHCVIAYIFMPHQEENVRNNVHRKPLLTPVSGAVNLVTTPATHAMVLLQQNVTFVLVGLSLLPEGVTLAVERENTMTVSDPHLAASQKMKFKNLIFERISLRHCNQMHFSL